MNIGITKQANGKRYRFLDPSLQYHFHERCLFHTAYAFYDRIKRLDFQEAGILVLLPKCPCGEALIWFRQSTPENLTVRLRAMKARFLQASQL